MIASISTSAAKEKIATAPTILVVDDNAPLRRMLDYLLADAGFKVLTAAGGREAIEIYRRDPAAIALVLLDLKMPDLDGIKTFETLQRLFPGVRCCVLTGCASPEVESRLIQQGVLSVIKKPFDQVGLPGTIRDLLA